MGRGGLAGVAAIAFVALAAVPPTAPALPAAAAEDEVPFPVERTAILKEEKTVYFVEGRKRIPKGVTVTCLRDVHIKAKGPGAVIEVAGALQLTGVQGREVILENVTVEPAATFDTIKASQTIFRGGGGIVSPSGKPIDGYLLLELMDFVGGARLDLTMSGGSVELSSVCADDPVSVRAVDLEGKTNTVRVEVRGCIENPHFKCQPHGSRVGLRGGLIVAGAEQVVVRLSRLGGALTSMSDWRESLIFDGNKVTSTALEFRQPAPGRFGKGQFFKCDVYSEKVTFSAPPAEDPKKRDFALVDRFWFHGIKEPKEILEKVVVDGEDDPAKNGVRVKILKVNERALELAGPLER